MKKDKTTNIVFKDGVDSVAAKDGKIRPVAPFLEVFAITDKEPNKLTPLTEDLLKKAGHTLKDIHWDVEVGNIKIFRRTNDEGDKIYASLKNISDHTVHNLNGHCGNFLPGKKLPLGKIQFISPDKSFPGIRLRFTPAAGKVYGASLHRHTDAKNTQRDPVIRTESDIIYDPDKPWRGYAESGDANPLFTAPAQIFAGYDAADGSRVSWGYVDDECDGFVSVHLKSATEKTLSARAHISAGPPAFAPDTLPVRVVSDELEQILLGPEVEGEVSIDEAEEIVRRALETIRLMNTTIMNGNTFEGRQNVASTMVRQDTNDFGRLYEPIMASSIVDNLALRTLHERVFSGLSTGAAPWFADVLRRPDEIGDLSNPTRRKMPALMRGADGRGLTLTHRMINMVIKAAASAMFKNTAGVPTSGTDDKNSALIAKNVTAQLHYRGDGNPFSILPRTAISNCFPGLEFDFRNLWRRAFKGIVLIENNNYVIDADEEHKKLVGCRLVAIDGKPTMVPTTGPVFPGGSNGPLLTAANPNGVSFMEWSNSMADVLTRQGKTAICTFTKKPSKAEVVVTVEDLTHKENFQEHTFKVNHFFEPGTAVFSDEIIKPGEMTQGLCAPWQNDYRECACYYWAASRPDFVNVVPDEKGLSTGDIWVSKKRTGEYIPDGRINGKPDSRLLSYDDLFENWEGELNFIIKGFDAIETK